MALAVVLLLVAVPIAGWAYMINSGRPVDSANVLSGVLAPVALVGGGLAAVWSWWRKGPNSGPSDAKLDDAAETLAKQLELGWRREAVARGITTPFALDPAWRWAADGEYASVADVSMPAPPGTGPREMPGTDYRMPPPTAGSIPALHELYQRLGFGRVVMLGRKGSGKSGALVLLTLAALTARSALTEPERRSVPVPVLVSMTEWDPQATPIAQWLTTALVRDHPFLKSSTFGRDSVQELFSSGRLALFLDGFDEMPEQLRPAALAQLRDELGVRLVLASRVDEFVAADRDTHFSHTAVIDLLPVEAAAATAYLLHDQTGPRSHLWRRFGERLIAAPDTAAARTLSTPLALSLVRRFYANQGDPHELLDEARFATADQIMRYLIGAILVVAYPTEKDRARETRFLSWLARNMITRNTRELMWWRVRYWSWPTVQPVVASAIFGLAGGVASGIAGGAAFGAAFGTAWFALSAGLSLLTIRIARMSAEALGGLAPRLAVAVTLGLGFGSGIDLIHELASGKHYGGVAGALAGALFGTAMGLAVGLVVLHDGPLVGKARLPNSREITSGLAVGGMSGIVVWLIAPGAFGAVVAVIGAVGMAAASCLTRPSNSAQAGPSAAESYIDDLHGSLLFGAVAGAFTGLGFWVGAAHLGWAKSLVLGVVCAALAGLGSVVSTSQAAAFRLGTLNLTLLRIAPARPMKELMRAYDRQVLRQVGTTYQFRHAELQDYLGQP